MCIFGHKNVYYGKERKGREALEKGNRRYWKPPVFHKMCIPTSQTYIMVGYWKGMDRIGKVREG